MIVIKPLTQEKPIIFESSEEKILNINTITLESADENHFIDVFCENKRKKEIFKICSLKKDSQEMYSSNIMLDLHDFKDKYEFYLKTKCKKVVVNIIGCYEQEEDEEESEKFDEKKEKDFVKEKKDKKDKKEVKMKEKKKVEKKEKSSESDSESNDDKDLEDDRPNVSLVELLNKKRKEEPQEIKPLTLKNLVKDKNNDNDSKKEKKENKNKDKDKPKEKNLGNKMNNKDKKAINK